MPISGIKVNKPRLKVERGSLSFHSSYKSEPYLILADRADAMVVECCTLHETMNWFLKLGLSGPGLCASLTSALMFVRILVPITDR